MKLEWISVILKSLIYIGWSFQSFLLSNNLEDKAQWFYWILLSMMIVGTWIEDEFKQLKHRNNQDFVYTMKRIDLLEKHIDSLAK